MTITVSQAAVSHNLTTLQRVISEFTNRDVSASEQEKLEGLISQASDFIRRYTKRTFALETVVETLAANGTPRLILGRTPIVSITSIYNESTLIDPATYSIEKADAGFVWRNDGWSGSWFGMGDIELQRSRFAKPIWTVTYVAGYVMPFDSINRTLPHDIERACLELVKQWFFMSQRPGNVTREIIGETRLDFTDGSADQSLGNMPKSVSDILDMWIFEP